MKKKYDKYIKRMRGFIRGIVVKFSSNSIKNFFRRCFLAEGIFFLICFCGCCLYYSNLFKNQVYDQMEMTMELYNEQMTENFQNTLVWLNENCSRNSDITSLSMITKEEEIYPLITRIQSMLTLSMPCPDLGGLFVYSCAHDIFIPKINESFNQTYQGNYTCSQLIMNMLRERNREGTLEEMDLGEVFLLHDDRGWYFLVKMIRKEDVYAGSWINLSLEPSAFQYFHDFNTIFAYADPSGEIIGNTEFSGYLVEASWPSARPTVFRKSFFDRYLAIVSRLDYCDYYLIAFVPMKQIWSTLLRPVYRLCIISLIPIFLFYFSTWRLMETFLKAPMKNLEPIMREMKQGEFGVKIETKNQFLEIQNITATFNEMISEIQDLRIDVYEQRIAKRDLELQYLRTQLAPHFLINCLNTIFVLSQDQASLDASSRMVQILSEHLRYMLSNRMVVSLGEELRYVENYFLLTQIRFPDTLVYDISLDEEMKNAQVFPLILLMLTENSIKVNMVMGETFTVCIKGTQRWDGDMRKVHLTHIDSGTGFDETCLEKYNHILEHPELRKNGYGIGLFNIVKRLRLMMGDKAEIHFSNEPGMGARVDLDFPYIPMEKELE